MEQLKDLTSECFRIASEKGFHDSKREFGTSLMLIVSELGEALEADRKNRKADFNRFYNSYTPNSVIPIEDQFIKSFEENIKDSVEDEIADTFIRLFDLCGEYDIDIETFITLKMRYNETRPSKHGKKY